MKYIISALAWFFGLIYMLFFLIFALIVTYIFPERIYDPWLKWLLRTLFKIMFIRVDIEGLENLDKDKHYLYMANHVSLFDVPLFGGYIPGVIRGVEAKRQHKWPLYGKVVGRLGNIPIERNNIHSSIKTIRKTIELMKNGKSMIILPEGGRTLDGNLKEFKKLPFFLAKQVKHEIIPIGISGLYSLLPKDSKLLQPHPIKMTFGKPITPEEIDSLSVGELRDLVKGKITDLIESP